MSTQLDPTNWTHIFDVADEIMATEQEPTPELIHAYFGSGNVQTFADALESWREHIRPTPCGQHATGE